MIEFIVRFALRGLLMIVVNQSDAFPLIKWRGAGRIQVFFETSTRSSCPNELTYLDRSGCYGTLVQAKENEDSRRLKLPPDEPYDDISSPKASKLEMVESAPTYLTKCDP